MKKLLAICFMLAALLCACKNSQYFGYELNEKTRVYLPGGMENANIVDSFDLYQNPLQPMVAVGIKIYYFAAVDDPYYVQSPMLACYDTTTGKAVNLCTDTDCAHYGYEYTTRCPLCDLSDYSRLLIYNGWLYYTRADYKTAVSNTGEAEYSLPPNLNRAASYQTSDEVEVLYQLMAYNLTTGETKTLYEACAENYLDSACLYDGKVYFCETHYTERSELIYERQDYDNIYFRDTVSGELVARELDKFYYKSSERQNKIEEIESSDRGYFSEVFLRDQRHNRLYKLENDVLWEKVYTLLQYDIDTDDLTTLVSELPAEPQEIDVFGGMLFVSDADACTRYDLNGESSTTILDYGEKLGDNITVSSLQYDQYTQNLYLLAKPITDEEQEYVGGAVYYVKLYEDGARFAPTRIAISNADLVTGYQLTSEGIYFTAARSYLDGADYINSPSSGINYDTVPNSGSLYYIRWPDKTDNPVPYYTVYDAQINGMPITMPTVINGTVYADAFDLNREDFYYIYTLYEIGIAVDATQQLDANADDTPVVMTVTNTLYEIQRPKTGVETAK
jgi:hypothetical protein